MQSESQIKARSTLSALAGLILVGILSACGGGSGSAIDRAKQDNHAVIPPGENPLNKYIGTFPDNKCRTNSASSEIYSGMTSRVILSASDKPNTLTVANIVFYYRHGDNNVDPRCGVQIGSSTAYGEMTYLGSLPAVEFTDSARQPLRADKFQTSFTSVINEGVVGDRWDEVIDYKENVKGLLAPEGDIAYAADYDSPDDAEGFPTKLDENNFLVLQ